ncbi:hypothetical protein CAJAP_08998 [Camponotus japonicus]
MPSKNKNVSKLTEYENNNSNINLNKTNVETFSSINKNTGRDFNQNYVKEKEFSSETYETDSTISTTDFQRYVVRKILDIDFKISTVHEEQKNINTKLDSIQNQIQTFVLDDGVKNKDVEVDYMEFFPLQTLEELEKFEQQLITQVARIGGTDVKSLTFNILRRLLSDSVGSLYSYIGGKKKRSFFNLYLRKIIFGAVRIYFPETTEQKISEPIKSWLQVHASERSMKKKNMDKRADTVSTQEDEDQAEEMTLNELTGPNI